MEGGGDDGDGGGCDSSLLQYRHVKLLALLEKVSATLQLAETTQ